MASYYRSEAASAEFNGQSGNVEFQGYDRSGRHLSSVQCHILFEILIIWQYEPVHFGNMFQTGDLNGCPCCEKDG